MAQTKKNSSGQGSGSSRAKSQGGRSNQKKATSARNNIRKSEPMDVAIRNEIFLILLLAAAVFLFVCNFGLAGVMGNTLSNIMFGIFGLTAYVMPLVFFLMIAFGMVNSGSTIAARKLVAGAALFLLAGIVCELFTGAPEGAESYQVKEIYARCSEDHGGGGVIAGSAAYFCYHFLGMAGTVLVLLVAVAVSVVVLTEKSIVSGVRSGGRRVYERSLEDAAYRRERARVRREEQEELRRRRGEERRIRAEERENEKILRMDKRVSGVTIDTSLSGKSENVEKTRDDIHEINLADFDEQVDAGDEQKNDSLEQTDFDFDKIKIHGSYSEEEDRGNDELLEITDMFAGQEVNETDVVYEEEAADFGDPVYEEHETLQHQEITYEEVSGREIIYGQEDEVDSLENSFEESGYDELIHKNLGEQGGEKVLEDNGNTRISSGRDISGRDISGESSFGGNIPKGSTSDGNVSDENTLAVNEPKAQVEPPKEVIPKEYLFPPIKILEKGKTKAGGDTTRELKETALKLQQTLQTFGVRVTITDISQGPSVTRFELQPEQGVKVSKIVGLTDDIKLNLAATDIRIEAPIPGKAAVGIEVPNKENMMVALRDLLDTKEFKEFPSDLAFAVGKDIGGKAVVTDIAKMPHLLIAGATGSGKSVCINTLIMSILYKAHPDDVKLIMVDPKVVELSVYNGIPHLLIPVVTDPKKASSALQWGVAEMSDRYQKFADYNVRNLKGYNKMVETMKEKGDPNVPAKMPQIVIIVDELADLMMVCPGEVEESICRLAQLARAAGIYLIIATQRPSVDVITGLIKANMPSRVAFSVSSGVDSRTILDMTGAEKLLGKGDMLFYPQGYSKPARVQGAFVSDKEVSDVVEFLKNQTLGNVYNSDIQEKISSGTATGGGAGGEGSERDQYFVEAAKFIIEKDKASIGMLQRVFKIGFNRAARIMDQLCEAGVVGEEEGTKPRKVLMSEEQFEQYVEESL